MNFIDALNEVIENGKEVRRAGQQLYDHDHPKEKPYPSPWHMWIRMRLDTDDLTDDEAILFIESRNQDDTTGHWYADWTDDFLSKEDIRAEDWEVEDV